MMNLFVKNGRKFWLTEVIPNIYSGPKNVAKFQESLHWHNGKHRRFLCVDAL